MTKGKKLYLRGYLDLSNHVPDPENVMRFKKIELGTFTLQGYPAVGYRFDLKVDIPEESTIPHLSAGTMGEVVQADEDGIWIKWDTGLIFETDMSGFKLLSGWDGFHR